MAELEAFLANHDDGSAREFMSPIRHRVEGTTYGAWHAVRIGGKVLIRADVDEGGAFGSAEKAGELFNRDGIE